MCGDLKEGWFVEALVVCCVLIHFGSLLFFRTSVHGGHDYFALMPQQTHHTRLSVRLF